MSLLVLIFAIFMSIWLVLLYARYRVQETEIVFHLLLNVLLNFCLIPCFGILLGMTLSLLVKRLNAYLVLVLFTLLGSPVGDGFGYVTYDSLGINLYPFLNFFSLFPPNLNWSPEEAFGLSVLPYRWEIIGFWALLLSGLLCHGLIRRKTFARKAGVSAGLALSLLCLIIFLQPSSKLLLSSDDPKESIMADWEYYFIDHPEDRKASALFTITEYDLDISVGKELKTTATITVDRQDLPEYLLTLYHGYTLKSVASQDGVKLSFIQDGDYITVKNQESLKIQSLRLIYKGHSPVYYSNAQGMYLPGYFPYYPHSGHRPVYDRDTQGSERFVLPEPVMFRVKIESNRTVYSNLSQNGGNTFSGESTGVTLLSGFYDTIETNGVTIVYPYLNTWEFNAQALTEFVNKYAGTPMLKDSIKTIFLTPVINNSSPYNRYAAFSDHLLLYQILGIEKAYENQLAQSHKYSLDFAYRAYLKNPEGVQNLAADTKANRPEGSGPLSVYEFLMDYLDFYGEEEGLSRISSYLQNKNDDRHWREFIKQFD